jgi:hypothetical protein
MNATALALPNWTAEVQSFLNKTAFYTPIVLQAFNKTLAPVIISNAKEFAAHWFESECYWRQRITSLAGITYNPLTASVSAAIAELTSAEAQATYCRIRHIVHEAAMDALVVGLCGVVAISVGVDVARAGYRTAAKLYHTVYDRLNPNEPQPELLPSMGMALASTEIAEALASFAEVAEADVQAKANAIAVELERKPKTGTSKAAAKPKQTRARAGARGGK